MARLPNPISYREDETLQDDRLRKALKRDESRPSEHTASRPAHQHLTKGDKHQAGKVHSGSWNYPPEFWDRLSTIPFTRRALEEFDRRTRLQPALPRRPSPPLTANLTRFARHGGPDLRDLRGCRCPAADIHRRSKSMSASTRSRATKSTDPTTVTDSETPKKKRSSAYDGAFEQHLTDHQIHATWNSQEPDFGAVYTALANPRPSLTPSQFSDGAFKAFRQGQCSSQG
ncbi:hypothetical protein VP1G_10823 [Cytospora mali]|uniref:Uncharacterized protein n=1 Tax=Cytospora mali TaxID=578113 RepID=A0A194UXH3_CYTMA|nr:hypothetical protein VP1G_10823 [Valsa mali var. pyri (nom. inval.)]